jgi:TonB family protein
MRRILTAGLLLSSLILPAAANASTPTDDATVSTPVRKSTGVTTPVLLDSPVLSLPQDLSMNLMPANAQVELSLTVDEKGLPQNVKVVKSFNPFVDASVIDTVNQMRFRPGTLDNRPTPIDLNLIINVTR